MRIRADNEPDTTFDAGPGEPDDGATRGGFFHSVGRVITLPFRIIAGAARLVIAVIGALITIVLFPLKLVIAAVGALVNLIADIVYGIWRAIMAVVGALGAVIGMVVRAIDATIGALVRLLGRSLGGTAKLALRIFTLGRLYGKASSSAASAASTVATKPAQLASKVTRRAG